MKTLSFTQSHEISGGVFCVEGFVFCVNVPSTGIPNSYYNEIDKIHGKMMNNEIDILEGDLLLLHIPTKYIETYLYNIDHAIIF